MEMGSKSVQNVDPREQIRVKLMECGCDGDGRCLVVNIDGTSNQFGEMNTNVIELYHLIRKEEEDNQLTWYNSGIGTYARPSWKSIHYYKQVIDHKVDLAIAWNFEKTILGAYRWLSDNYRKGDRIFLFGFSRGAFQVRALAGMIHKVGLIHKGNELQIPFAYELYADPRSDEKTRWGIGESGRRQKTSMAEHFKRAFSRKDVKVHFVGAWDTVSSIGIARGKRLLPYTIDGMEHVCYFRLALALDERRVKFLPEYAYGGSTLAPTLEESEDGGEQIKEFPERGKASACSSGAEASKRRRPQIKEVWFAGTHSDIGGGAVENVTMDRSRPSLRWMVFEAEAVGLRTSGFRGELSSKDLIEVRESLTWAWWPLEILPIPRLTFTREANGRSNTLKPHLGAGRKIQPGQKIHASLILASRELPDNRTRGSTDDLSKITRRLPDWLGQKVNSFLTSHGRKKQDHQYTPKARPPKEMSDFWNILGSSPDWLEFDVYDEIDVTVDEIVADVPGSHAKLQEAIRNGRISGRQALYGKLVNTLSRGEVKPEAKYRVLSNAIDLLCEPRLGGSLSKIAKSSGIRELITPLTFVHNFDAEKVQTFMLEFTDRCMSVIYPYTGGINAVAYSVDGRHIVSGSMVGAIQLWNAETGEAEGPAFGGRANAVHSVAFSPDGSCIASGSEDNAVRLWDVQTGKQIGRPLSVHTSRVRSVAFSPDERYIASASEDGAVKLWDRNTGQATSLPIERRNLGVYAVAFSPDSTRIASGSWDGTVRLWDTRSRQPTLQEFAHNSIPVCSVAFSPDGKWLASSSWDRTIRLWNLEVKEQDERPFEGHKAPVNCVAFSPDGKRLVSGSDDKTVRLWNIEARKEEGPPLTEHTDEVKSVVFSPDGKHIASGSKDGTIRIWDVEDLYLKDLGDHWIRDLNHVFNRH
ncbi:hypothetical protein CVT26_012896 [Gymnopilus dilepis]|uniref:T6SS Phospholipase effector Tle1-like catalytic domain-containing protein n=1 Tax=Gymnopilus dilepis TaxID=231916 RepID=A0A409WDC7_9AGAR|nr:hypothetical protein CVT26_012896 [Gymnopilus dilepis]